MQIGFVWQHIAPLPMNGTNWELTTLQSVQISLRDPASCITELAKKEIPRTMHVFFRDYEISLEKCGKLNKWGMQDMSGGMWLQNAGVDGIQPSL